MTKPSNPAPTDYESAMKELEGIVAQMEQGDLALQQAFTAYQRGFLLLQYCQTQLQDLEAQVKVFENGQLKTLQD